VILSCVKILLHSFDYQTACPIAIVTVVMVKIGRETNICDAWMTLDVGK